MISKLVILKGSAWNSNTSDTYTYQDVSYVIVVYSHMLVNTYFCNCSSPKQYPVRFIRKENSKRFIVIGRDGIMIWFVTHILYEKYLFHTFIRIWIWCRDYVELIDNKLGGIRKKVSKDRIKYCRFGETLAATVSLCFRKQKNKNISKALGNDHFHC